MNFITEILLSKNSDFYLNMLEIERAAIKKRIDSGFSFYNQIPESFDRLTTSINEIDFTQGDIVERPMYNRLRKLYLKHYGIYCGTKSEVDYILNKEADGYIYVRTLDQYMKDIDISEVTKIEKPHDLTYNEIIDRAKKIEKDPYEAMNNNCQHFVNVCIFDSHTSLSVDQVKQQFIDKFSKWKNRNNT